MPSINVNKSLLRSGGQDISPIFLSVFTFVPICWLFWDPGIMWRWCVFYQAVISHPHFYTICHQNPDICHFKSEHLPHPNPDICHFISGQLPPPFFYRTQVYLGSDLWVPISVSNWVSERHCANLTDMTLTYKDTNPILTDNVNRASQGKVVM